MIRESDSRREWQTQLLGSTGGKVVMCMLGERSLVLECWARSGSTSRLSILKQRIVLGAERPRRGS